MKDHKLSKRVKELRKQNGLTQEQLAENSGLSLRTIQRVENNETVPRGDSLKRLARALATTPDEIIDWQVTEDKGYLTLMCLSAMGFLFFPILGVIIPLIFWILKKDKLKKVNELGKSIMNFEITWCIIFFSCFILMFFGFFSGFTTLSPKSILLFYIPLIILYFYNFAVILINSIRIYKEQKFRFVPAFRIFK
jgi:transcriptional regulator with XRE-family HTH domain